MKIRIAMERVRYAGRAILMELGLAETRSTFGLCPYYESQAAGFLLLCNGMSVCNKSLLISSVMDKKADLACITKIYMGRKRANCYARRHEPWWCSS